MNTKRFLQMLVVMVFALCLVACGKESAGGDSKGGDSKGGEAVTETATATPTNTPTTTPKRQPDGPVDSDQFVNFEDMSFFYNGKKYTLGVTTLQDLANDGVEFSGLTDHMDDTVTAQHTYYLGYSIDLMPYNSATMTIANFTDEEKKASACVISSLNVSKIPELPEGAISFLFPDVFTREDLVRCAGEPDTVNEFDGSDGTTTAILTYKKSSTVYYGNRTIEFTFKDGLIHSIHFSYIP